MPMLTSSAYALSKAEWVIRDIIEKLYVEADGGIRYGQRLRKPPTARFAERLHHLSPELRRRYLWLQCRSFLYGFYFLQADWTESESPDEGAENGVGAIALPPSLLETAGEDSMSVTTPLANNLYKGLDVDFYDALVASNCGEGYHDPGWQVVQCHGTNYLSVQKNGLTLEAERDVHLLAEARRAAVGDKVALRLPAQRVEAERYIAIGNRGLPQRDRTRLQVFFNLKAEGAAALVEQVTQTLNGANLAFQLQVLSHPELYGQRCDGAVMEINRCDYGSLSEAVLQWAEVLPLLPETLPMTQRLLPGISAGELLNAPSTEVEQWQLQEPFGLLRCEAIAEGLVAAHEQGLLAPAERYACVAGALEHWGVHPQLLSLNQGSEQL